MQLLAHLLGGKVEPGSQPRVRPRPRSSVDDAAGAVRGAARARSPVWMSHGDQVDACRRRLPGSSPRATTRRSRPFDQRAADLRHPVPPRGRPHARTGGRSCATSSSRCAASARPGRPAPSSTRRSTRSARAVGDGARDLRPLRRRRLARSPRPWCTARSAISSPASSSTTACSARTRRSRFVEVIRRDLAMNIRDVDASDRFLGRARAA